MSNTLTSRQKIIRLTASAAICGLSISFALGEVVDAKAQLITQKVSDPRLLPREYSLLKSISAATALVNEPAWKNNLVALNELKIVPAEPDLKIYRDEITTLAAKPAQVPAALPLATISKAAPEAPQKPIAKSQNVTNKDVDQVLLSIHTATAKASPKLAVIEPTKEEKKELPKEQHEDSKPKVVFKIVQPEQKPKTVDQVINPLPTAALTDDWAVTGKIIGSGAQAGSHFEVGAYSKIDQDGNPIGFPLVQQILPAGKSEFQLAVPGTLNKIYLFGELVGQKVTKKQWINPAVNPIEKNSKSKQLYADLFYTAEDSVKGISAAALIDEKSTEVRGRVLTMFSPADKPIPQADVVVKIRGRKEAVRSNKSGEFSFDLNGIKGNISLEILKNGYFPMIITVPMAGAKKMGDIFLVSKDAIGTIGANLGIRQSAANGVYIGEARASDGTPLRGMTAQLSLKAEGPYYFENGYPSVDKKATGPDGRFIFFNVEPGAGYLETTLNGEAIAPTRVSFVDGGQLVHKKLVPVSAKIHGRVFDPVATKNKLLQLVGARVRLLGSSESANTDAFGFFELNNTKVIQGEPAVIDVSSARYHTHRYTIAWEKIKTGEIVSLFAFPSKYISRLAASMDLDLDSSSGMVIGKISGASVRLDALSDHSSDNTAKDFYFDAKGKIRGSHNMSDPRFGTFVIFNVPKGNTILQGNDNTGKLKFAEVFETTPSTITVVME